MPRFGTASMFQLVTCSSELQDICRDAIKVIDFSVLSGKRGVKEQKELFDQGKSQRDGTYSVSKHQLNPSRAVDLMPYPGTINGVSVWDEPRRFHVLAGIMLACADVLDISLVWGGDWDGDYTFSDQKFFDLGHFELRGIPQ